MQERYYLKLIDCNLVESVYEIKEGLLKAAFFRNNFSEHGTFAVIEKINGTGKRIPIEFEWKTLIFDEKRFLNHWFNEIKSGKVIALS